MGKPKLLVLTSSFPKYKGDINGNFVYELTVRLKSDFDIFVLAPAYKGCLKYEIIDDIKVFRHKQFIMNNVELAYGSDILAKIKKNYALIFVLPFYFYYLFNSFLKIIKNEKITLIHAHWIIPQGFVAVLYKTFINRNITIIATAHGADINSFNNTLGIILKKYVLKRIDVLTAVSDELKKKVINIGYKRKVYVYPMGVDTSLFSPEKKDISLRVKYNINGKFLLFVGGIIERKGIRYLIQAMPSVIKQFPETKLVVVGEGNLKKEMIELADELKVSDNIIFTGSIPHDDLPSYFATADIFILPSLSEGWPVVVMEALSSGTKTIVTNLPVFYEHDKKEKLFSIVPIKNSNAIATKIIELLRENEFSEKNNYLRLYAKQEFDWTVVSNRYSKIILNLL